MPRKDLPSGWVSSGERTIFRDEHGRILSIRDKNFKTQCGLLKMDKDPNVVSGRYKPFDSPHNSYPPRSFVPIEEASRVNERHFPHYGDGSVHSDRGHVDYPASTSSLGGYSRPGISTDVFRDSKRQLGSKGPPDSDYNNDYDEYKKRLRVIDMNDGQSYERYKITEKVKYSREDIRARRNSLGGDPRQTQAWHQTASEKARTAAESAHRHADARSDYNAKYIGYHEYSYRDGHKEAVDATRAHAIKLENKARQHDAWESLASRASRAAQNHNQQHNQQPGQ